MKLIKTLLVPALALLALVSFPSCSDDKDQPEATPAAKSVAGTYRGDMTCSVMGQESTFADVTFTVSAKDDTTVDIAMPEFGEPPMKVPAISVADVKVTGTDGTYTLASTTFSGTLPNGKNYSGTLQGDYASDKMTIRFNLQYGAMPMPMICSFTAPKQ